MTKAAAFDRATAERTWRTSLLSAGGVTVSEVEELHDHLLQVEEELLEQLPPEEAFWVAAHRTGTPEALTREFAKVRPNAGWLLRAQWVLLGFVLLGLLKPVADLATGVVTTVLAMVPGLEGLAYLLLAVLINTSYLIPALIAYLLVRRLRLDPTRLEGWLQRFDFRGWWGFGLAVAAISVWRVALGSLQTALMAPMVSSMNASGAFGFAAVVASLLFSIVLPAVAFLLVVRLQKRRTVQHGAHA